MPPPGSVAVFGAHPMLWITIEAPDGSLER